LAKSVGTKHGGCAETEGDEDFMLSQSNPDKERSEHMVDLDREDLLDYEDSLEKEKLEMEKLEACFEERTNKLASNTMSLRDEGDLMDVDKQLEGEEEIMADGEVDDFKEDVAEIEQFKIVHHKREAINKMLRSSVRVEGENMKILDKATAKKEQDFKKVGLPSSSYTVFNSFDPLHFVNIATASGIMLDNDSSTVREAINVLLAKEKAEAMLNEARKTKEEIRREREEFADSKCRGGKVRM
jgi:hypothetical protein